MFRSLLTALLLCACGPVLAQMPPPKVTITSPNEGEYFTAPASVEIVSSTLVLEDGVRIPDHDIIKNGAVIHRGATRSVSTTVTGLEPGTHSFWSRITDNLGRTFQSAPVRIIVVEHGGKPPKVSLGSPRARRSLPPQ